MSICLYADEFRAAIYEEAPGGGDPMNPNSSMNRPVLDPIGWLGNIYFHSDLNYYGVAAKNMNVVINHEHVPGITRTVTTNVSFEGQAQRRDHVLINHNLGYVPKFFVLLDGRILPLGIPIQDQGLGKKRFVSAYATTTQIRLWEVAYSSDTNLDGQTRTYQVIVFRDPASIASAAQLDLYPGQAVFGKGKFMASEPHLRVVGSGDAVWPIATGRTTAIRNGGLRAWYPNGGYVDFQSFDGSIGSPSFINVTSGV